jgi:predicted metal-dependent hydrolase
MKPQTGSPVALQLDLPLFEPPVSPCATTPVAGGAARRILIEGQWIQYELIRARRRSIGFIIDDRGLRVSAPRWITVGQIESAVHEKSRWIVRKLIEWREHAQRRERLAVRWESGGTVTHLGRPLTLCLEAHARGVRLEADNALRIGLPPGAGPVQMQDAVQAWLQKQARQIFGERLAHWCPQLGVQPTRWQLSSARTRWGSCTAEGAVRLNWRLVHFPLEIIDYVIVHELAHLRELNHGPQFWATVQSVLPEFEVARRQLKDFPDDLHLS